MLSLFQLLLAVFAIYSALNYTEEAKLLVPLVCLVLMLFISRIDKVKTEKKTERDRFLKEEIDQWIQASPGISFQDVMQNSEAAVRNGEGGGPGRLRASVNQATRRG